ncbi:hypothetical protein HDV00_006752 [Rhizophlyctis rosea]|nr:hypothetical protein HDV00_006752 [Rhizophlyctis rosea]
MDPPQPQGKKRRISTAQRTPKPLSRTPSTSSSTSGNRQKSRLPKSKLSQAILPDSGLDRSSPGPDVDAELLPIPKSNVPEDPLDEEKAEELRREEEVDRKDEIFAGTSFQRPVENKAAIAWVSFPFRPVWQINEKGNSQRPNPLQGFDENVYTDAAR